MRAPGHLRRAVLLPATLAAGGLFWMPARAASVAPTDFEQYLLELVNRARANPGREAARLGIDLNEGLPPGTIADVPRQPLAPNGFLTDAAQRHAQWMLDAEVFSHTGSGGSDPDGRMAAAGYVFTPPGWTRNGSGENLAWRGTTGKLPNGTSAVEALHRDLFLDEGVAGRGHRLNILEPAFKEAGNGVRSGPFTVPSGTTYNAWMAVQDFAFVNPGVFLTGVVFNDTSGDHFYTPGEGAAGVVVRVLAPGTGAVLASTTTLPSGGYALKVSPGTYDVAILNGNAPVTLRNVVVTAAANVKVDSRSAWIATGDGAWHAAANWLGGVPDGTNPTAVLATVSAGAAAGPRTVTLAQGARVGTLKFDGPHGFTVAGPGTLTLEFPQATAGIKVLGTASHRVSAAVRFPSFATVDVASGAGDLTFTGAFESSGPWVRKAGAGTLTIAGAQSYAATGVALNVIAGTLNLNSDAGSSAAQNLSIAVTGASAQVNLNVTQHLRALSATAGKVTLAPGNGGGGNGGAPKLLYARSLTLSGAATLELGHADVLIVAPDGPAERDAALAAIAGWVRSARDAGTAGPWTGPGLTGSAARLDPLTTLAALANVDDAGTGPLFASLAGQAGLDANAVIVLHAMLGDANLDGRVDAHDYYLVDRGFALGLTGWRSGDFDLSGGPPTAADYLAIDAAFLRQGGGSVLAVPGSSPSAVPEPGVLPAATSLLAGALLRRPRRSRPRR